MLNRGKYDFKLLVRDNFNDGDASHYPGAEIVKICSGRYGNNRVETTPQSSQEIDVIETELRQALSNIRVVLTHDLIYQPNMWKHHIAARRIAQDRDDLLWVHWVHSATNMNVRGKVKSKSSELGQELDGQFPNSYLVAMHPEEIERKRQIHGYERGDVVLIPNAIDFLDSMHPVAQEVVKKNHLMSTDIIAVYPCRLDRGKQPHVICEVFDELAKMGQRAKVIICDFHSISGDKNRYRTEMKSDYGHVVFFTSDIERCQYSIPHKAVMDLMEIGDVMIHPSRSESDPLILQEAMWKKMGLVLNYDLTVFRQYNVYAQMAKFSSNVDALTGMPGETNTNYGSRRDYMKWVGLCIKRQMEQNPVLKAHQYARRYRSIEGVWKQHLQPVIEAA
jgi:glycosyltransferase involved in cell wall biosynthesis